MVAGFLMMSAILTSKSTSMPNSSIARPTVIR